MIDDIGKERVRNDCVQGVPSWVLFDPHSILSRDEWNRRRRLTGAETSDLVLKEI